ncbi:MAG: hypothetical protein DCC75_10575 [Proteobacteria bacterium]|nr:MAG: hypothetical protein DCC75_10575 [Pseudomonadota bacterium]
MRACPIALAYILTSLIFTFNARAGSGAELYEAVLFQDLPKIQSLISKGADVNYIENGRPILGWAAQNGSVKVVEALLKAGANPNIADQGIGHTPLMRAIDMQHLEIVRALLGAKADPNAVASDGRSCLMMAVESRKPQIVQALVDARADVKKVDAEGNSPALAAAQDGMSESLEIIAILGRAGAEMNASNAAYTPLVYAVQQGNKDLVQALLKAGADPNGKTQSGQIPIQYALDDTELLQILLQAKADPNVVLASDSTLLMEAIQNSQTDAAKILINAGADTQRKDYAGNTPLDIAERYSQTEVVELIKQKTSGSGPRAAASSKITNCTIADAAKKQMELHGLLQAQVNAGKMNSDIFRTFNDDTKDYAEMLSSNPNDACQLFERLRIKYGV